MGGGAAAPDRHARGLPVTIYRPGRITGDSRTGQGEPDDAIWKFIVQIIKSGLAPAIEITVDMTPVDFASRAIVHLSAQPNSAGRTFHVVNPRPTSWAALGDFVRARGYPLRTVSVAQWKDQANAVVGQGLEKSMFAWLPLVTHHNRGRAPGPPAAPIRLHRHSGRTEGYRHLLPARRRTPAWRLLRPTGAPGVIHSSSKLAGDDGRVSAGLSD